MNVDKRKYQIVDNPLRSKVFRKYQSLKQEPVEIWPKEQREALERMGLTLDAPVITVQTYQEFKAIGYCKNKSLAILINTDVSSVHF